MLYQNELMAEDLHPIVCASMSYLQRKIGSFARDTEATCVILLKNGMHIILWHAVWPEMHPCLEGNLQEV